MVYRNLPFLASTNKFRFLYSSIIFAKGFLYSYFRHVVGIKGSVKLLLVLFDPTFFSLKQWTGSDNRCICIWFYSLLVHYTVCEGIPMRIITNSITTQTFSFLAQPGFAFCSCVTIVTVLSRLNLHFNWVLNLLNRWWCTKRLWNHFSNGEKNTFL